MSNAQRDENTRPTMSCASKNDGITIVPITANPITHALTAEDSSGGSDNGNNSNNAMLDENSVPVLTALSSAGDDTIVEVYGNPTDGSILIDSF